MKKSKPTILVVNDDGITAPGIKALIEVVKELGNVVVVAPDSPQSGNAEIRFLALKNFINRQLYTIYRCAGTGVHFNAIV